MSEELELFYEPPEACADHVSEELDDLAEAWQGMCVRWLYGEMSAEMHADRLARMEAYAHWCVKFLGIAEYRRTLAVEAGRPRGPIIEPPAIN